MAQQMLATQKATRAALKAMRGEGLSQEAIAKRVGTTQATVSRWENGQQTPSAVYVTQKLAPYVPDGLMAEVAGQQAMTLEDRVAALEDSLARIEAALSNLQGG